MARDRAHRVEECGDALGERGGSWSRNGSRSVSNRAAVYGSPWRSRAWAARLASETAWSPSPEAARWTACAQSAVHANGGAHVQLLCVVAAG
jgi:hypothetical protein